MLRSPSATLLVALLTAALLTGCSDPATQQPPTAALSAAPATSADDPPGAIACGKAIRAVREATLMNPGIITDITNAAATADAPVADAAARLSTAYTDAVAAHNKNTEPDAIAAVSAAAAELVEICNDSGLETAG
ncbi:hypothetical protein [Actinoplanes sp. NPDC049599]|uniref:hypothetical protein n=1 Tax=Actinoplanes sp. NPDC049599 TaxID=3363903 RepID=UPI003793C591